MRQSFNYFRCLLASHSLHTLRIWSCPVQSKHSSELLLSIQPWWEKFSCDEKCRSASSTVMQKWLSLQRTLQLKEVKNIQAKWVHLGNLAYTVAWCKCTMMHHSEDCTDGASSWTVGACRLHQSVTGVSGSVVWGGLHKRGRGDCISSDILSGHTLTVDMHLYPVSPHYLWGSCHFWLVNEALQVTGLGVTLPHMYKCVSGSVTRF